MDERTIRKCPAADQMLVFSMCIIAVLLENQLAGSDAFPDFFVKRRWYVYMEVDHSSGTKLALA